jgi:NAD(P)-dependent dehydrogenase (short-subunit alcohol dehydrogenase family)
MEFSGKVIAVTGGASGIGLETARQVLECGGSVAIFDLDARELAQHKVRVNVICPGTVNTAMFQKALVQDGEKIMHDRVYGSATRFRSGIPLRRIAEVDDPASSILFFLSEAARHITGQTLFVDGGESII